jgi:hypothetical protein
MYAMLLSRSATGGNIVLAVDTKTRRVVTLCHALCLRLPHRCGGLEAASTHPLKLRPLLLPPRRVTMWTTTVLYREQP